MIVMGWKLEGMWWDGKCVRIRKDQFPLQIDHFNHNGVYPRAWSKCLYIGDELLFRSRSAERTFLTKKEHNKNHQKKGGRRAKHCAAFWERWDNEGFEPQILSLQSKATRTVRPILEERRKNKKKKQKKNAKKQRCFFSTKVISTRSANAYLIASHSPPYGHLTNAEFVHQGVNPNSKQISIQNIISFLTVSIIRIHKFLCTPRWIHTLTLSQTPS